MAQQIMQHVARKAPGLSILISKSDSVQRCSHILNVSYATLSPLLSPKFGHSVNPRSPKRPFILHAVENNQSHIYCWRQLCPQRRVSIYVFQCYLQKSLNSLWTSYPGCRPTVPRTQRHQSAAAMGQVRSCLVCWLRQKPGWTLRHSCQVRTVPGAI